MVRQHVLFSPSLFVAMVWFAVILFTLQWLFSYEQLSFVLTGDNGLDFWGKVDFLFDGFLNIFRFIDDFVPITLIIIALLQSTAIAMLLRLRKISQQKTTKKAVRDSIGPLSIGLIGSGCVACGGSILSPLLGAIASNVSVTVARGVGDILLLLAVILSYRALTKIAFVMAKVTL